MVKPHLRLFVTGNSQRSARAIAAVQAINEKHLNNSLQIEIVDVLKHPDRAEVDKVLATPTLIRATPAPPRRLVGDLGNAERIIHLLGLDEYIGWNETE